MGKKKIVIDTHNLIAALGWEGKSRELLRDVIDKKYNLFISVNQIIELKKVMNYPKFNFTNEQKEKFLRILSQIAIIIDTKNKLNIIKEDPEDNMILECALESNANYIISGDKHLLKLKKFKNIKIISISDFLKE